MFLNKLQSNDAILFNGLTMRRRTNLSAMFNNKTFVALNEVELIQTK